MEEQEGRSRRQKSDKHGRSAAFEKLKQLKGSKNKYEVSTFDNVYEEVDEVEYSKTVLERQVSDWIIDDDGSGYVEDGREIFDDDLDDDSILFASKNNESGKRRGKKGGPGGKKSKQEGKSNHIYNMLVNMPSKKRKRDAPVKLEDDDILGDIMEELNQDSCTGSASKKKAIEKEMTPESYLRSLAANSTNRVKKIESPVTQIRSSIPEQLASTPIRPKVERKHVTPRVIQTEIEAIPPCVRKVDESDEEDTTIIEESQPDNEMKHETPSQIIEDFDSSDGFLENANLDTIEVDSGNTVSPEKGNSISVADKVKTELGTATKPIINSTSAPKNSNISDNQMLAGWETMVKSTVNVAEETQANISVSELPLITNESGDQVLRFFWWDAYEEPFKQPGVVYLFGKVYIKTAGTYVSCCVVVKEINRKIYLLPREERIDLNTRESTGKEVKIADVYEEFNKTIAEKNKILQFKCRKVERSYCFSVENVPLVSEYLEIKYPAHHLILPSNLEGETFSHVFGTRTSSLERFLLERKIKGPCWLDIKNCQAVNNPISWCKIEAVCNKMEDIHVAMENTKLTPPPLVVLSLNFRTILNSKTSQNEVVMVGCLVHNSFPLDKAPPNPPFQEHFCVFTRSGDGIFPIDLKAALCKFNGTKMERTESERALLGFLVAKIFRIDPDLIVGHDLHGFGLDLLIHRLQANKIPHWSKVGRLRRSTILTKGKHGFERQISSGRLVCDIKISAKELMRARSYDLGTLCEQVLHIKEGERKDLTPAEVKIMYTSSNSLLQVASLTMQDAAYVLRLMCELNVIPLALQITNIAGNVMSRTLMGGRAERNEFLLLHAFYEKNYIVPDKEYSKKKAVMEDIDGGNEDEGAVVSIKGRKKAAYVGGLVLEPKKGFYDTFVLLMDFNSLYPSIIQEYNICFTTIHPTEDKEPELPKADLDPGILPTEIKKLVDSRKVVKKLMKANDLTPDLKLQYNIRQLALKLTANSMYGCLGFSHSRFYAKPLAALITAKGREILLNTKYMVEKMGYEVIYGDTDSIMINTKCQDYDQVFKIGNKIKQDVNKSYRLVELDVDGVFKYLLLLKKKKYAAVTLSRLPNGSLITQQENKGLDIVRRDWSKISASAGSFVLEQILSDLPLDDRIENIHNHLMQLKEDLENGKVPLELLTITKQLTKNVEEYFDKKAQPHVLVASRLNSSGNTKRLKQGDTISYIICEDGTNNPATQRAYHVNELKENDKLKVDVKYYLSQQIHPVVSRLCDPIDGTDAALIAQCLGLDPNSYKSTAKYVHEAQEESAVGENVIKSAEEQFKNCSKFKFTCMNDKCNTVNEVDGAVRKNGTDLELILERCCNPKCTVPPYTYLPNILNKLTMAMRHYIDIYYMSWLICEDPGCPNRTRQLPTWFCRGYPVCNMCHKGLMYREYSEADLINQLLYFQYIFTVQEHRKILQEIEVAYGRLADQVKKFLSINGYDKYDLADVFSFMDIKQEVTS